MVRLRSGSSTDDVEPFIRRRSTPATRDHDDNTRSATFDVEMASRSSTESTIVVDTSFRTPGQAPLVTFHHDNDRNSVTSDVEVASQSDGSTIVNTSFRTSSPQAPVMASFTITSRPKTSAAGTQTGTNMRRNELSDARHTTANEAIASFHAPTTAAAALPTPAMTEAEPSDDAMDVDNNTTTLPALIYDTNYHNAGAVNPNAPNTRPYWIWEVLHAAHLRLPELDLDHPIPTYLVRVDSDPTLPTFPSDSDDENDDEDCLTPIPIATVPTTPANDDDIHLPTAPDGTREFFVDVTYDRVAARPWGAVLYVGRLPAAAAEDPDHPGQMVATIDATQLVDVRRLGWLQAIGDTDVSACLWLWRRVVDWAVENGENVGGA